MKRFSQPYFSHIAIAFFLVLSLFNYHPSQAQISPGDFDMKVHKVVQGETLYSIARLYNVSAKDIKETNELQNPNVYAGLELIIPGQKEVVRMHDQDVASRGVQTSPATPNLQPASAENTRSLPPAYPASSTRSLEQAAPAYVMPQGKEGAYYLVQKGDDLFSISDSKGVTAAQLKTWNPNASFTEGETIIVGIQDAPTNVATRSLSPATASTQAPVGDLSSLGQAPAASSRSITTLQPGSAPTQPAVTAPVGSVSMPELGKYGNTSFPNQRFEEYSGPRLSNSRYYALHKTIPVGTKANISIPGNGGFIQVEIVGKQPINSLADLALSPESFKMLNATPNSGTVTIAY